MLVQVVMPDLFLLAFLPVHVLTHFRRIKEYSKGLKREQIKLHAEITIFFCLILVWLL